MSCFNNCKVSLRKTQGARGNAISPANLAWCPHLWIWPCPITPETTLPIRGRPTAHVLSRLARQSTGGGMKRQEYATCSGLAVLGFKAWLQLARDSLIRRPIFTLLVPFSLPQKSCTSDSIWLIVEKFWSATRRCERDSLSHAEHGNHAARSFNTPRHSFAHPPSQLQLTLPLPAMFDLLPAPTGS